MFRVGRAGRGCRGDRPRPPLRKDIFVFLAGITYLVRVNGFCSAVTTLTCSSTGGKGSRFRTMKTVNYERFVYCRQ